MDGKLDKINENLTGFFKDIVTFIEKVWKFINDFFAPENKLWDAPETEEAE
jgi:hypothetical protein